MKHHPGNHRQHKRGKPGEHQCGNRKPENIPLEILALLPVKILPDNTGDTIAVPPFPGRFGFNAAESRILFVHDNGYVVSDL